jgi:hypothetical protein
MDGFMVIAVEEKYVSVFLENFRRGGSLAEASLYASRPLFSPAIGKWA